MNQKALKIFLSTILFIGLVSVSYAQRTTETGTLDGTVSDDGGQALPGVTITISSPSLMLETVSAISDQTGFYRFPQISVGLYKVTFTLPGFKTIIREGIKISLGVTTTLNERMEVSSVEETVIVTGQAPTVDIRSTTLGITIDRNLIQNIPNEREFTSAFEMAPGVALDGDRPSSFGSAVRDNVFNIDGVSISSPESGVYGSVQVGYEIAEEFQVETGGHPAEYGGVRGSVVNMITKSGGNQFSGEVNLYLRHHGLQADNTQGTPFAGNFVGFNYDYDATVQLGGPIVRNKLWFFANLSRTYEETYVEGYPYDEPKNIPTDYGKTFPSLKLSYQINPSMQIVASWNGWWSLRGHRSASRYRNADTTWIGDFRSQTLNLSYSYQMNSNMILTARAATAIADLDYLAKNDLPSYYEYDTQLYSGSMGYDYITQRGRAQALTDFTYYVDDFGGRHEFKTGLELNRTWAKTHYQYHKDPNNGIGYLLYTRHGLPYRGRDYESYTSLNECSFLGGFIQDRWEPTDRLTLNLGIRFEHQEAIFPKQGEDRIPFEYNGVTYDSRVLSTIKSAVWNNFSPRIGLSYSLTADAKTALKVNFGRYYLLALSTYFDNANPNGYSIKYYTLNADWSLNTLYSFAASSATRIDPDLEAPYVDELIVGIERELIPDFSLSLRYIAKWDRNDIEDVVTEALDVNAIKNGEYVWSGYTPVTAVDPYNGQEITFYNRDPDFVAQSAFITNPQPARRNYNGFEVLLEKRFSKNWQLVTSYVYSKGTGLISGDYSEGTGGSAFFNDPNVHTNALGRFPGERRHQIKVQGSFLAPLGLMFSCYYRGYSGTRFTRVIRSDDLGLGLNQGNVTIFAEERGSEGLPWLHLLDLRAEKQIRIGQRFTLGLIIDAFNVLNLNTTTAVETLSSAPDIVFDSVTGIMNPRVVRLGTRISW